MWYKPFCGQGGLFMRKTDDRRGPNIIVNSLVGGATGFMCAMILLLIMAVLTAAGKIPEKFMREVTVLASGLGGLVGSFTAAKRQGGKALIIGLCSGAAMFLLTLVIAAFTEKGAFSGALTPTILTAIMVGGIAGGFLCATPVRGRR